MSLILLIETATTACSVALANDDQVIALREVDQRNIHAEVITVFIDELFKQTDKLFTDIDAVVVSAGPGSYTGLRIGVSTAKGLCFSIDKPLVAVETLLAMAYGFIKRGDINITPDTLLCPMIDARRMEVYTALFDAAGNELKPTTADIIDEQSFAAVLATNRVIFFGDGAAKCKEALSHQPNAIFAQSFSNSATDLLLPGIKKINNNTFEDVAYFEPFYLKDFIAGVKKK
ncbi:tRNA threonylcarbamoyladenosine biosynthesis protein TsaB [Mucilaginibacter gracilis]|uniref:tRNA threonylcarbamoyladenosine biosynthesis protein TsaB n=1 Tax=Mucilaginibacter gracilis TaxID=423350 RepID=A0A495J2J3_9SPHI|nr:tRNA (adenosine(37)-N6)-threonylcarbamoyltransferase complex dimerization subunit type 1 TsaB [Mucilaginibacter gracilis]RKR83043.1 tRNA threonylcarbamoyladenosine biosynthesis protein TsaB [Mucilaginibacter gracilis]